MLHFRATYFPDTLRKLGLPPESFNVIGIKAGYLSPEYQEISKTSILALTEGDTALELKKLPYTKTPRPISKTGGQVHCEDRGTGSLSLSFM